MPGFPMAKSACGVLCSGNLKLAGDVVRAEFTQKTLFAAGANSAPLVKDQGTEAAASVPTALTAEALCSAT